MIMKTTRNFWDALPLIFKARMFRDRSSKDITFRNGITLNLNWREYADVREIVSNGYIVRKLGKLYLVVKGKMKLVGPLDLIVRVVNDHLDRVYECECKNKVVLDVGGFIGDTAVLFSTWGARKIIIYEPVKSHHEFIKMNIMLNGFEAELHDEGVSDHQGFEIVRYDTLNEVFGLEGKGTRKMTIRVKDVGTIIKESHAGIAKFDCEGAENSLISVTNETLRLIETYLIEIHTSETRKLLLAKFQDAGFICVRELRDQHNRDISFVRFKRKETISAISKYCESANSGTQILETPQQDGRGSPKCASIGIATTNF